MKKQTTHGLLAFLGVMVISGSVFAEDGTSTTTPKPGIAPLPPIKQEIKDTRASIVEDKKDFRQDRLDMRKEANGDVKDIRLETKTDVGSLRAETKIKVQSGELKPEEAFKTLREEVKKEREENRTEVKAVRDEFQTSIKEKREDVGELIKEKREGLLESIQEKRDLFKEEFEARKDEVKAKREEAKEKFQESLKKIKDEAKRAKVETIANTIPEINIKTTDRASEQVKKIETVLVAIESRTDKAAASGIDVSKVRALISSAETAIASARAAIVVQVGKTYSVTIVSDTTVKSTLETTRDGFRADVKIMNTAIKAAHEATRKAAEALKTIPNIDTIVVPPSSTTTSTTTN